MQLEFKQTMFTRGYIFLGEIHEVAARFHNIHPLVQ